MDTDELHDILRDLERELRQLDRRSRVLSEDVNVERAKEELIRKTVQRIEGLIDGS